MQGSQESLVGNQLVLREDIFVSPSPAFQYTETEEVHVFTRSPEGDGFCCLSVFGMKVHTPSARIRRLTINHTIEQGRLAHTLFYQSQGCLHLLKLLLSEVVITVAGRILFPEPALNDVLRTIAHVRMQQVLQVAAQINGGHCQAKGNDVLQEEEHRARTGCLTSYPHLTERTHRGGMRIAPVRRQHGEERQQEQHSRGQQQVEAQVALYGNVEPRVHQPPCHLYQQPGQKDDRRIQADILRIELEEDLPFAGS